MILDRRTILQLSVAGLAATATPGFAKVMAARGFTHAVASGEPSASSVLLWTRYVGSGDTRLTCEISRSMDFRETVGGGEVIASAASDYCVKITVGGLPADSWLYYRFIAPNGDISAIGRTRTLPKNDIAQFGIGLFSCSNLPFGWFNAYAHAALRNDLDLMVHVGDYFYEYPPGTYPSAQQALPGRTIQPDNETITRADYRLRYAAYRADPDLQRLHQLYPMIAQWDDHELTNDAWKDGAQNHQPESEGDWETRKKVAESVYHEWMPVSGERYGSYQIGNLATLIRPETRIEGRMKQPDLAEAIKGQGDIASAIGKFRDGVWSDPARTMMGMRQEKWLQDRIAASVEGGTRWQILAQQVIMGRLKAPPQMLSWLPDTAPKFIQDRVKLGAAAAQAGLPFNFDAWDGYPAARSRLLAGAQEAGANLAVLAGDSHNAWGNNLTEGGKAAGVEFATHSVTSPGFESFFSTTKPADTAKALRATNPGLAYVDTSRRGYVSLMVTADSITGNWHFLDGIRSRGIRLSSTHSMTVKHGARVLGPV